MIRRPPTPTLFPSTPLFRSGFRASERHAEPQRGLLVRLFQIADHVGRHLPVAAIRAQVPLRREEPAEPAAGVPPDRSEEHTSELQSQSNLGCRLLLVHKNTE